MAFRATKSTSKKPAATSTVSADSFAAPQTAVPEKEISLDDLVGAPVQAPVEKPAAPAAAPVQNPVQARPSGQYAQNQSRDDRGQGSRWGNRDRGTMPAGRQGYHSGGRDRFQARDGGNRFGGGRDRQPQGGVPGGWSGYQQRPPRVERTDMNAFTQDIDVPTETVKGILDVMPDGHGFLRPKFTPSDRDVYISQSQIRRFLLRNGDMVQGQARQPKDNERYWGLLKVETVNEQAADTVNERPRFEDLTPVYPNTQLRLETGQNPLSTRIIDLVAPIGFGQRGLVVSPPKAGKTTILKELAAAISENYPKVHLMAALIGERPEEVTDISRSVKGEVLASNFDESPQEQTRIAEVALDRAKRLVEMGQDVVVLLDSITRLARAYNLVVNPSGRTLSGGFDPAALYPAKKFLGAARCVEPSGTNAEGKAVSGTGGSLTVIGTALVDTGSRMDDMIYEEFKGTGNMELHLSRILQERRIFPAIDVGKSGTRHDELLLGEERMKKVTTLRHMLSMLSDEERTVMLIDRLGKTKSNDEFLDQLSVG